MKIFLRYLLLTLAVVPLIVDGSVFFPYITGKSMFIRIVITLVWAFIAVLVVISEDFHKYISLRIKKLAKSPIFWSVLAFSVVVVISAIFAKPNFRAIFGNIERAEGLVGMLYYLSIGILMMILFRKNDWKWFFRISLIVGVVLFVSSLLEYVHGVRRPSSFLGNPIYLAVFFLYTLFMSWWMILKGNSETIWRILAFIMLPISFFGIFLTETRGVVVGMIVAVFSVCLHLIVRGGDIKIFRRWSARVVSIAVMSILLLSGVIFISTKNTQIWQKIPGLDRLSEFSLQDSHMQSRLVSFGISWNAIHPKNEGWKKFLIGWGPDNFNVAFNKYYNPRFYRYEAKWFDRPHDKILGVAVMNGVLGLIAYLFLWLSILYAIIRKGIKKENIFKSSALLFFAVAYFVQNLTVFDSTATYIVFFSFVAFVLWYSRMHNEEVSDDKKSEEAHLILNEHSHKNENNLTKYSIVYGTLIWTMAIYSTVALIFFSFVPYLQMHRYISFLKNRSSQKFTNSFDSILKPYTVAQENIRTSMLSLAEYNILKYPSEKGVAKFTKEAVTAFNGLITREPYEPIYYFQLAQFYINIGDSLSREGHDGSNFYKKAISLLGKAIKLSPKRQELLYDYAYTYAKMGYADKAISILKKTAELSPEIGSTYYYLGVIEASEGKKHYLDAYNYLEKSYNSPFRNNTGVRNKRVAQEIYKRMYVYFKSKNDTDRSAGCIKRLEFLYGKKGADIKDMIKNTGKAK